jgi:hypothetical protein
MPAELIKCSFCNEFYSKKGMGTHIWRNHRKGKKKEKYFCSSSCANSRGPRSDEIKTKISESLKIIRVYICPKKLLNLDLTLQPYF